MVRRVGACRMPVAGSGSARRLSARESGILGRDDDAPAGGLRSRAAPRRRRRASPPATCSPGTRVCTHRRGRRRRPDVPRGHKLAVRAVPPGAPVHKYGQVDRPRHRATSPPATTCTRTTSAWTTTTATYEFGTARVTLPTPPADRPHLPRLPPRRRPGRHPQLRRHPHVGQLLGVDRPDDRRPVPRAASWTPTRTSTAWSRSTHDSGCGLVPDQRGRPDAAAHPARLRRPPQHRRSAGARPRLRDDRRRSRSLDGLDLPAGHARRRTLDHPGDRRHPRHRARRASRPSARCCPVVDAPPAHPCAVVRAGARAELRRLRRLLRASPRTRRSASPPTSSSPTAAPRCSPRRPRCSAPSTCSPRRAVSPRRSGSGCSTGIDWWQGYAAAGGGTLDNNPSPGNKAGGLTTILEKSLGAVAKGGTAELIAVYEYAEPVTAPRLRLHGHPRATTRSPSPASSPAARPSSCFTTGRGSVLGLQADAVDQGRDEHRDLRADDARTWTSTPAASSTAPRPSTPVGDEIFELILAVASGRQTVERGARPRPDEFVPWQLGAVT